MKKFTIFRLAFNLDGEKEIKRIEEWMHQAVYRSLYNKGMVVGINARIDSSIVLSTCAREFDPEWVISIFPQEMD